MNEPIDDRIANSLRSEATPAPPDAATAHAEFLARRRRRYLRIMTGTGLAAVLALTAGALALANHHNGKTVPVAATGRATEPQPLGGTPGGTDDTSETTTTAAHTTTTGAARATGSGTVSGTAGTARPVPPPATTTPTPTPTTSVSTPPGGHHTVSVSEADNGKSYTLHVGDTLYVGLAGGAGYYWSKPQSSDENVLRPTGPAYMPTANGGNAAAFAAASNGNADVTSTGDPPCRQSTPPCMAPSKSFVVHVTVES